MNFSVWALKNPILIIMLFIFTTFAGIYGFNKISINSFPDINFPAVTILVSLPGSTPEQVEKQVTSEIENSIKGISNIKHITSTIKEGSSFTKVEFDLSENLNDAVEEIKGSIDKVKPQFPIGSSEPYISKVSVNTQSILTYQISSNSMDITDLSWYVDNQISKLIDTIPGVSKITRQGGVEREIQILLDLNKLTTAGTTIDSISDQFYNVQQDFSGGLIELGGRELLIQAKPKINDIQDIANLYIPLSNSSYIRLDQIAKIIDTHSDIRQMAFLNGKPVITFDVYSSKEANELEVANLVNTIINKYNKEHPDIKIQEISNHVEAIRSIFSGSMEALYEGALFTIIVLWYFLRDLRVIFVVAAVLPLSMLPTFYIIYWLGFSLNMITLLALTLVIGILVDDAIVEIDNIMRHLKNKNISSLQAIINAVNEIGTAVIATSITLVAIFLPTAFMSGIPGQIFKQFGWTVSIAVLTSLLVTRLLTPIMAAYLLTLPKKTYQFGMIMHNYIKCVEWCLEHPRKVVFTLIIILFTSLLSIIFISSTFVPAQDYNQITFKAQVAPGSPIIEIEKVFNEAYLHTKNLKEIANVYATIGNSIQSSLDSFNSNSAVNKGILKFNLVDSHKRKLTQAQLETKLNNILRTIPGAQFFIAEGGSGEHYSLVLAGEDPILLKKVIKSIEHTLLEDNKLNNLSFDDMTSQPELIVDINYNKAAQLGITTKNIGEVIRIATSGDYDTKLPKLNLPDRQIPIRIKLAPDFNYSINDIDNLRINGNNGTVPLSSVAHINITSGPTQITHYDYNNSMAINIDLHGQSISEIDKKIHAIPLMKHLPGGIHQILSGDTEMVQEMYHNFYLAIMLGISLTYCILALLFKDFKQPLTILSVLPMAIIGSIFVMEVLNYSISMSILIGILILIGVVTKNSILLVDYMLFEMRNNQCTKKQAIINACINRSRPIIMTTMAMIMGMIPIIFGFEGDSSFRSPMALTVIGGLVSSTFLSLFIVPVVFMVVDDFNSLFKRT